MVTPQNYSLVGALFPQAKYQKPSTNTSSNEGWEEQTLSGLPIQQGYIYEHIETVNRAKKRMSEIPIACNNRFDRRLSTLSVAQDFAPAVSPSAASSDERNSASNGAFKPLRVEPLRYGGIPQSKIDDVEEMQSGDATLENFKSANHQSANDGSTKSDTDCLLNKIVNSWSPDSSSHLRNRPGSNSSNSSKETINACELLLNEKIRKPAPDRLASSLKIPQERIKIGNSHQCRGSSVGKTSQLKHLSTQALPKKQLYKSVESGLMWTIVLLVIANIAALAYP